MRKHPCLWIIFTSLAISGCARGIPHNSLIKEPPSTFKVSSASISEIKVTFADENEDAKKIEDEVKQKARAQLEALLEKKNIKKLPSKTSIQMDISVDWGNKALRHFVSFGAGAGHVTINISLQDRKTGLVIYETETKADLTGGMNFGGDMNVVIDRSLASGIEEFGSRLPQE